MAARRLRPGRTLVIFFLGVAVLYGLVALAGTWKPQLGLDLQGGTRISLAAEGETTDENLEEARRIIDQRVNGQGVTEAEVTTQGGNRIVVEVPGSTENRRELEESVKRTAQLRFRLVACSEQGPGPCATGGVPSLRPAPFAEPTDDPTDDPSGKPSKSPTDDPSETTTSDAPSEAPAEDPAADPAGDGKEWTTEDTMAWINAPSPEAIAAYNAVTCTEEGTLQTADGKPASESKDKTILPFVTDTPDQPLVSCEVRDDSAPIKYLLSRSIIEGTELTDASAGIPQGDVRWVVNIEMGNDTDKANPAGSTGAEDDFETLTQQFAGTDSQFAIVLDGVVLSAPTMEAVIYDGKSQISGDFNEASATSLANSLKFGALPIDFENDPLVEEIGPSLAGNQLNAGLLAGGLGLALVMLYCLLYYRVLGSVVVASLFVAAGITYGMVLLLGETAGFTLTLPGIAGLIIAVGITADSFVIYFERIRDEMREGKSMRVAVETGWARARVTRVAANTVSILSAVVLYILATGAVKGFGFALGLSTLIDLAVLFWFTKPALSWLGQFRLFNSGHRFSGLSPETLGIDAPVARKTATAGGNA